MSVRVFIIANHWWNNSITIIFAFLTMKIRTIHIISLALLLVLSLNFGLENFVNLEWESFTWELNDSEIEMDDLETKKAASHHKFEFLYEIVLKSILYVSDGYSLLEFFEKIPTPPPEV